MRRTVWDEVQEILDEADALVRRADRREKSKKLSKDDSASTKQRETQMHRANEAEVERLCREVEQEFGMKRGRAKAATGERMAWPTFSEPEGGPPGRRPSAAEPDDPRSSAGLVPQTTPIGSSPGHAKVPTEA